MIFVDSNVPMYLVGADHPNRARAQAVLRQLIRQKSRLVTDAEVFQEILHRYTAIRRPDAINAAWQVLEAVVDEVHVVEIADVERARRLIDRADGLSARDALHAAIMQRHEVTQVFSFDRGFDSIDGIVRMA